MWLGVTHQSQSQFIVTQLYVIIKYYKRFWNKMILYNIFYIYKVDNLILGTPLSFLVLIIIQGSFFCYISSSLILKICFYGSVVIIISPIQAHLLWWLFFLQHILIALMQQLGHLIFYNRNTFIELGFSISISLLKPLLRTIY